MSVLGAIKHVLWPPSLPSPAVPIEQKIELAHAVGDRRRACNAHKALVAHITERSLDDVLAAVLRIMGTRGTAHDPPA